MRIRSTRELDKFITIRIVYDDEYGYEKAEHLMLNGCTDVCTLAFITPSNFIRIEYSDRPPYPIGDIITTYDVKEKYIPATSAAMSTTTATVAKDKMPRPVLIRFGVGVWRTLQPWSWSRQIRRTATVFGATYGLISLIYGSLAWAAPQDPVINILRWIFTPGLVADVGLFAYWGYRGLRALVKTVASNIPKE